MKDKKMIFAAAAIALAVAIIFTTEKMTSVRPPEHRTRLFPNIEERHITALEIKDGNSTVKLEKQDGAWTVSRTPAEGMDRIVLDPNGEQGDGPVPADSASAQIAVEKIASMKKGEPVSTNPANQAALGVDTASGMLVSVFTNGNHDAPAEVLIVGNSGASWNSSYVRALGSDAVYIVTEGLRQTFFTEFDRWKKPAEPSEPEASDMTEETAEPKD